MALTDHNDVFIGSTDDAHTFVLLNRAIPGGHRILTAAGFSPHEHLGRTVYLLPPEERGDAASDRTSTAMAQMIEHTLDIVELAWTTTFHSPVPTGRPEVHIQICGATVMATADTDRARAVLAQCGFVAQGDGVLRLPDGVDEPEAVGRIVRAEAHLLVDGCTIRVDLGIATPADLPPAPGEHA
ncbi:hypothetical protein ACFY1P_20765 [Streptomyces sp. NPDC001407]|uniref:hypothetical protein n=1 Tax=Streptomyces sp. NPDC001407 TaxID=3364573 RepID=UPI0036776D8A